jgi:hypothetical protein
MFDLKLLLLFAGILLFIACTGLVTSRHVLLTFRHFRKVQRKIHVSHTSHIP